MRGILFLVWLVVAGLTAFSAFKYKSQSIEDDITARTAEELGAEVLEVASLDVDGRHVTLKGVVASEDIKDGYLETADQTYGALGPIDGLVVTSSQPFLSATKSDDGVVLRGIVGSADIKSDIVARAQAFAPNGTVDDQLTVSPNVTSFGADVSGGIGQLAGLRNGQYLATGDSETLSGTAQSPVAFADISSFGTDRANWTSTVAEPVDAAGFQSRIATLDAEKQGLEGDLAKVTADFGTYRTQAEEMTVAKDAQISELETELSKKLASGGELAVLNAALTEQTETLDAELSAEKAKGVQFEQDLSAQVAVVEGLQARTSELEAENTELGEELAKTVALVSQKDAQIAEATDELATVNEQLATATSMASQKDTQIAELTGQVDTLNADLAKNTATDSELSALNDTLTAEVAGLSAEVDTLKSNVAARDVQIDTLLAERQTAEAQIDQLTTEKSDLDAEVTTLKSSQTTTQADFASLVETRDRFAANLATLTGQKAVLEDELAATKSDLSQSQNQIASLQSDLVAEQEKGAAAIAAAAAAAASTNTGGLDLALLSGQCSDAAQRILEDGKINFVTGTAQFTSESAPIVERMTGITLACANDGLQVEIGGHTDARGADADNQALSEARANAIRDYMIARGVSASSLTAVGYGETQPIATNDTAEGMTANRRISFDWRAN